MVLQGGTGASRDMAGINPPRQQAPWRAHAARPRHVVESSAL